MPMSMCEIGKSCGAHRRNLPEGRSTSLQTKCRPTILVSKKYIVCAELRMDALRIGRQRTFRTRRPEFR